MRWKQFFTPVTSVDADAARRLIDAQGPGGVTLLDVRQPSEYQGAHIPGTQLIPLPDLSERMNEIDPSKPVVVY